MLEVFKSVNGKVSNSTIHDTNIWVNLVKPNSEEVKTVSESLGVYEDFLLAALDPEESARIEYEDDQVLIVLSCSVEEFDDDDVLRYTTLPLGIIILEHGIITVCNEELKALNFFKNPNNRHSNFAKKTRFTLNIINRVAMQFLSDIRRIDRRLDQLEVQMHEDMKNSHLLDLMALEKNLVYFTTAVKSDENILRKIIRSNIITKYEEDEDILEDTLIEIMQANEMTNINLKIVRSVREGFATIINNNSNTAMKFLAALTILFTFPTIVFSFYGMNTNLGLNVNSSLVSTLIILISTLIIDFIIFIILKKYKML